MPSLPLPPDAPDAGPRGCCYLVLSLRARHYLDPGLVAHHCLIPDPEHTTATLFLKLIVVDDLDPTFLGLYLPSPPLA
jgi:hypothetical protein